MTEVTVVVREKFEVVPSFCYLGDCLSSSGGCELASITTFPGRMGKIQWTHARRHIPLISHRLPRKSL